MALRRHAPLLSFALGAGTLVALFGIVLAVFPGTMVVALGVLYAALIATAAAASGALRRLARVHEHLAHHDSLTGLPNRMLFTRRLGEALAGETPASVIVADVDRFKDVNDSLGHLGGDEILRGTAGRLQASVRTSDTVARLGGDEFAILLPGASAEVAQQVARRIVDAFAAPIDVDGSRVPVAASLGVACSTDHGPALLRAADAAMYAAKEAGGGFRVARKTKAPGQAIGGLRPVRRATPAKSG